MLKLGLKDFTEDRVTAGPMFCEQLERILRSGARRGLSDDQRRRAAEPRQRDGLTACQPALSVPSWAVLNNPVEEHINLDAGAVLGRRDSIGERIGRRARYVRRFLLRPPQRDDEEDQQIQDAGR